MIAGSPQMNDINNIGPPSQVEMGQSSSAYQSNPLDWKSMNEYNMNGGNMGMNSSSAPQMHSQSQPGASGSYDQMVSFASDEDDYFDPLSDKYADDDSQDSSEIDDSTRIQQL
jgi:hypothetical protein